MDHVPHCGLLLEEPPSIALVNVDGSGRTVLRPGSDPEWAPDGARLDFRASWQILQPVQAGDDDRAALEERIRAPRAAEARALQVRRRSCPLRAGSRGIAHIEDVQAVTVPELTSPRPVHRVQRIDPGSTPGR
jgi:hypothetical protein